MNRNLIYSLVFMTGLILISQNIFAQYDDDDDTPRTPVQKVNAFFGLQVGVPSKDMQPAIKNNMGNLGFGVGLTVLTNPFTWGRNKRNSPLRIGGEVGYTYYGRFISDVNINGFEGDYKTSYGILQANAILQLRPSLPENLSPFVEVLAGGNFYLSSIRENLSAIESGLGIPALEFGGYSSASFNKGVAVGCSFGKPKENHARLTIRVSYNWADKIKYVVRNSLDYNPSNGRLEYYVGQAPVKYFMVQVGIGI